MSRPGCPSTRTYWNPWVVWRGSNDLSGAAGGHHLVDLGHGVALEREVADGDVAAGVECLSVEEGQFGALRAEVVES